MRKSMMILALAATISGLGVISSATAAPAKHVVKHKYVTKKHFRHKTVVHKKVTKVVRKGHGHRRAHFPATYPVAASAYLKIGGLGVGACGPAPIVPACQFAYERIWIAPVYRTVVVGTNVYGQPIYSQQLVIPGSYRMAKYRIFSSGARQFVCYV